MKVRLFADSGDFISHKLMELVNQHVDQLGHAAADAKKRGDSAEAQRLHREWLLIDTFGGKLHCWLKQLTSDGKVRMLSLLTAGWFRSAGGCEDEADEELAEAAD